MIKSNFIVLTGGPGSGKSTVLNYLSQQGYKYIGETGRKIIRERLDMGLSPRPDPVEFARQMFELDYKNFIDNLEMGELVFFDRSFLDSASLLVRENKETAPEVNDILSSHRFHKSVFIMPPWKEIYKNDNERDQTFDESVAIYELLFDWYRLNGYSLIVVPKTSVENRIKFILNNISM